MHRRVQNAVSDAFHRAFRMGGAAVADRDGGAIRRPGSSRGGSRSRGG